MKDYLPELVPESSAAGQKFFDDFSPFVHEQNCLALVEAFEEGQRHIERNGNPKIIFLDTSLQVMSLLRKKREMQLQ